MAKRIFLLFIFLTSGIITAGELTDKLKIIGAYNYGTAKNKNVKIVAIEVTGDINLIGDPDDIRFVNAETGQMTDYAIDDFSFLSPDGKQAWQYLPEGFDRKNVRAVFIVGAPLDLRKIKLIYDGLDISDAAYIKGSYPPLPPMGKRIRNR